MSGKLVQQTNAIVKVQKPKVKNIVSQILALNFRKKQKQGSSLMMRLGCWKKGKFYSVIPYS